MPNELTYEQLFGSAPKSTGYSYTGTGVPLPRQQAAVYDELRAAGGLDPRAAPGSPRLPRAQMDPTDTPKPGEYYVPAGGGGVQQQPLSYEDVSQGLSPDQMPVSESLGFKKGLLKAPNNAATWLSDIPALPSEVRPEDLASGGGVDLHSMGTALHSWLTAPNADVAQRMTTERPGKIGEFGGNLVGTAPLMLAPGGPVAQGALMGAALTDHPNDPMRVLEDAGAGGAGAYIGGKVIGGGLSKLAPKISTDAQALVDAGVPLTPGQYFGGAAHRIEDAATSTPVLGDAIRTAQRRGMEGFNKAGYDRALNPIGETLPSTVNVGRDGIGYVQDRLGAAYDKIAPQINAAIDPPFISAVGKIRNDISPSALDQLPEFDRIVQDEVLRRMTRGTNSLDGQAAKDAQTAIGNAIRKYSPSTDPKTQAIVRGLTGLQDELDSTMARNSAPEAAAQLNKINEGWANFVRLQTAAGYAGTEKTGGLFSPSQLGRAAKAGDSSVRRGAYARGDALMQDLAGAGERVLPSSVPDSGTALRYLVSEAPMLIGFGSENAGFLPHLAGAVGMAGMAGLPYTSAGQKALARVMATKFPLKLPTRGLLSSAGALAPNYTQGLLPAH